VRTNWAQLADSVGTCIGRRVSQDWADPQAIVPPEKERKIYLLIRARSGCQQHFAFYGCCTPVDAVIKALIAGIQGPLAFSWKGNDAL